MEYDNVKFFTWKSEFGFGLALNLVCKRYLKRYDMICVTKQLNQDLKSRLARAKIFFLLK